MKLDDGVLNFEYGESEVVFRLAKEHSRRIQFRERCAEIAAGFLTERGGFLFVVVSARPATYDTADVHVAVLERGCESVGGYEILYFCYDSWRKVVGAHVTG